jgi:predicted glycoside hydrolase/deacetylase ChbG (UPF0249 family)
MRAIAVCADDFGLHDGIDQAAVQLARLGRITAISCLVDGPAWRTDAAALRDLPRATELGLHLNLTELLGPGRTYSLRGLILRAYARALDHGTLRAEIQRQLGAFIANVGRLPDFVDGHQHVHQLPGVREALLAVLDEQAGAAQPWLRCTLPPVRSSQDWLPRGTRYKALVIARLGGAAFAALAAARGYRTNGRLLGVYGFDGTEDGYLDRLRTWLALARDGDLLMCHPAVPGTWRDPLLPARVREFRVLSSDAYGTLLQRAAISMRQGRNSRPGQH